MQKHYYNNGVIEKVIPEDSIIPEGFIKGRLKSVGKNISKIRRDYTWFNNGLEEIYIKSNLLPPIGFAPGRLPRDKQWSENMSKSHKNFRW